MTDRGRCRVPWLAISNSGSPASWPKAAGLASIQRIRNSVRWHLPPAQEADQSLVVAAAARATAGVEGQRDHTPRGLQVADHPGPPKPQVFGLRWPYRAATWARVSTGAADGTADRTVTGARLSAAAAGGAEATGRR